MLNWPKGPRGSDGIWSKIWYNSVNQSSGFELHKNKEFEIPSKYTDIYKECLEISSKKMIQENLIKPKAKIGLHHF